MRAQEATKQELMALEEKYWNAVKEKDVPTATSLSDATCVVVGAQGVGELDRPTLGRMLKAAKYELEGFSFSDVHLRQVSDDVAAVAYKVKEDLVVDGKKIKLEAFESSVWKRQNGQWLCVLHTESLAGDPFGRGN